MSEQAPIQVFLAEDNPGDVYLVREALNEAQLRYTLAVAADGEIALQHFERLVGAPVPVLPDVVLLDLNLPKVEGDQVLQKMREHRLLSEIPVIIVTSSDSPRDRSRLEALGATRYFRKPANFVDFLSLGALVREVVNQRDSNRSGEREHHRAGHDKQRADTL